MKNLLVLLLMLCLHLAVFAQNTGTVSGKVTDKQNGEPLVGATVSIRGSNASVVTDNNGSFKIGRAHV